MRNDVKLGFAIGGVLLAVVIVFALVNSTKHPEPSVDPTATATDTRADANKAPLDSGSTTPAATSTTTPGATASTTPPAAAATTTDTHTASTDTARSTTPASRDPWECLQDGKLPTLMNNQTTATGSAAGSTAVHNTTGTPTTETPSVARSNTPTALDGGVSDRTTSSSARVSLPAHPQQDDADNAIPRSAKNDSRVAGTTVSQPTLTIAPGNSVKAQTHTIKSGETFSTIATAYYGHIKYARLIAKANPGVDSSHLKIGQVINLPAFDPKTETAVASPAAKPALVAAIDTQRQYRVQKGDSLHAISMKLYGDAKHVDAIYDANKSTIGPAREKLKLDMVLALPTPPTATQR